jgi:SAM-dependent methyltransferase
MTRDTPGTPSPQARIFLEGEGDRWHARNASAASKDGLPPIASLLRVLGPHAERINRVLDIGCGTGAKLAALCRGLGAQGEGLDPSAAAIADGKARFGGDGSAAVALQVGTAAMLPFDDGAFDLVLFGFSLCLVDRPDLFRVAAEADRVLQSGGFLAIHDFDPSVRHKRPWRHQAGVFCYKTDHAAFFTAGGQYHLVAKDSLSQTDAHFVHDSDERVAISILYKEPDAYDVR